MLCAWTPPPLAAGWRAAPAQPWHQTWLTAVLVLGLAGIRQQVSMQPRQLQEGGLHPHSPGITLTLLTGPLIKSLADSTLLRCNSR